MKKTLTSTLRASVLTALTLVCCMVVNSNAQPIVFNFNASPNLPVIDNGYNGTLGSMISSQVTASGIPVGQVTNIAVDLSMTHTWIGDLTIKLQAPDGTVLGLMSRPGYAETVDDGTGCCGNSSNLDGAIITFADNGATDAETMGTGLSTTQFVCTTNGLCSYFPNPGAVATPPSTFAQLYSGTMNGNWTLYIGDSEAGDVGNLLSWEIRISVIPYFECLSGVGCQASTEVNAWRSDASTPELRSEGFVAQTTGPVSSLCWYGAYFDLSVPGDCASGQTDDFTITYYRNNGGVPGTLLAGPFGVTPNRQISGGNIAGVAVEYGYEASHPPVNLIAGQGYWVSIVNNQPGNCNWFWSQGAAGDGITHRIFLGTPETQNHDLAFCLNVPINSDGILSAAPNNDVCEIATPINCGDVITGSTATATLQDAPGDCGTSLNTARGVWFSHVGTGATVRLSTCAAGSFDTKLGVFTGSCGSLSCLAGNDDMGATCSFSSFRSTVTICTTPGETYYIYLTGFGTANGNYELTVECLSGTLPANDLCVNAEAVQTNSATNFDNTLACTDGPFPAYCGGGFRTTQSDLWYSYTADVSCPVTVSLCGSSFDTQLGIFDGTNGCPYGQAPLSCDDNFCGQQSQITFTPTLGSTYLIRVAGLGAARGTGTLTVSVTDTENPVIVNCPSAITVDADAGSCEAALTIPVPQLGIDFTDNCTASITNLFTGTSNASGSYPIGANVVIWTVTDFAGNTATCNQSVTVNDAEGPAMDCGQLVLFNSGPFVNGPGQGVGGADLSILQGSLGLTGFGLAANTSFQTADDFIVSNPNGWVADEAVLFTYQTGSTTAPTITGAYVRIWNGIPGDPGSTVIHGDLTTNVMVGAEWSGAYRVSEGTLSATNRPVMKVRASLGGISLSQGTYWLEYYMTGSIASGPWVPPITINGETTTGNSIFTGDGGATYQPRLDGGTGTPQGLPFLIIGNAVQEFDNDAGTCGAVLSIPYPNTSDCSGPVALVNDFNGTADASGTYPVGTTTVNWTATDAAGNSSTCSFTVTVTDVEAPTITCPPSGGCNSYVSTQVPVAIDDLSLPVAGVSTFSSTLNVGATGVVTSVQVTNVDITHTWINDISLRLQSPSGTVVQLMNQTCGSQDNLLLSFADNGLANGSWPCPPTDGLTYAPASPLSAFNGESAGGVWTLEVVDNWTGEDLGTLNGWGLEICASNIVSSDPGVCTANVTVPSPSFADNCSATITNNINGTANASGVYPVGTTTVTWTVTDGAGLTNTCTYDVVVEDNEAPVISCSDVTVNSSPGQCGATVTFSPSITDNCPGASLITSVASGTFFPVGTTVVEVTGSDAHGNAATPCSFTVTVVDNEAPALSCPSNISVNADAGQCSAVVSYTAPVGTDGCDGSTAQIVYAGAPVAIPDNNASGATATLPVTGFSQSSLGGAVNLESVCFQIDHTFVGDIIGVLESPNGTQVVLFDRPGRTSSGFGCGGDNIVACVQTGTGNDMESVCSNLPAISGTYTAHAGTDLNSINNGGPANGSWLLRVTDAAGGDVGSIVSFTLNFVLGSETVQTAGLASGSSFPVGATTNTFVSTDAYGNSATCSFTVTVTDNQAPTFTNCPSNVVVDAASGGCSAAVTWVAPSGSDNCGSPSISASHSSGSTFPVGVTTVTYTATDGAGLTGTCSFTVTVNDSEDPVFSNCPSDISLSVNAAAGCSGAVSWTAPSANDNCGPVTVTSSHSPGDSFAEGTTLVTYTATDANGRSATCTFNVTITCDPLDCNGDPNGTAFLDNCNVCVGGNTGLTACVADCNGDFGGTAFLDDCNVCVGGNTGLTACVADCNGDFGGTAFLDNCNVCVGGNTGLTACVADCNGDFGGTAFLDDCNVCVGGNTGLTACVADCNGDFGGTAFIDNCNVCVGGNTGLTACPLDCNGDDGGTAFVDNCGTCVGGNTGLTACVADCNGDFGGTAFIDECGDCAGGNTGIDPCIVIGVETSTLTASLKVYPNPNNGQFTIELTGSEGLGTIRIMDMVGRNVYTRTVVFNGSDRYSVELNAASGTYVLQLITEKGVVMRKLEVQ